MVLSKEKTEQIIKKIEDAVKSKTGGTNFKCAVCTNNKFSLVGGFINNSLMDSMGGDLVLGGSFLPSIPIVCTNCGNTLFINSQILGLNEEIKKEEKKDG